MYSEDACNRAKTRTVELNRLIIQTIYCLASRMGNVMKHLDEENQENCQDYTNRAMFACCSDLNPVQFL